MLHEDRSRAESFGASAERYDRSRPSYPPALIDALVARPEVALVARPEDPHRLEILDVGCGTGIASKLLAARGAKVLGVEIDPRMAEVARSGGIEVEVSGFVEWEASGRRFDAVTAGQAWHWVDPVAGAEKAAAVLRPGGRLAPFWNVAQPPRAFQEQVQPVYDRLAPKADTASVQTAYGRTTGYEGELGGMRACRALGEPEIEYFPWSRVYSRDEWLDQLPTHSDHARLEPDVLARLIDEVGQAIDRLGGSFEMGYRTQLITATRR